ncbi:synphilin-1 isoform X1 [Latimeria chalumnae]|uniref:Synuclein alpha interacting protein n=1 Tax=Latimeria chalumnae TaxID=7897 RepID=H3A2I5_LATCH|nr:PREDICTED: synphilin-1 [Latimeria chalumnae]|eukprot:XP_006013236.1 PREDICTED: synphilin-1 [Latimeria chalumnae]
MAVSNSNWSCAVSTLIGTGQKPTGIADVYSKFRPVKRVSPLKHQPENTENEDSSVQQDQKEDYHDQKEDYHKGDVSENTPQPSSQCLGDRQGFKAKEVGASTLLGDLEHYDLDMDEILDVPYIKSNQQLTPFTKVAPEKRILGVCSSGKGHGNKTCSVVSPENLPVSATQFCVLSPVKSSELRKAHAIVPDQHKHSAGGLELSQALVKCGSIHERETQSVGFLNRTCADSHVHKTDKTMPNCQPRTFHLQMTTTDSKLDEVNSNTNWNTRGGPGERNEDLKKVKSILNIVKEGQISLLPHLAVDNLEKIHDENGNNLLHIAASQGHAECLQHLTSLMGEDCLNERNNEKLTPAGLAIKNGQLECVRWMVSETEAIAELSCCKDHPSLIHYAACYGQEKILLWLLQFMQEQGISLDEVDQYGNSAVHIASQHGYLGCIQTLVEYGANVTIHNQAGEKPSQSAEHHGHTTCSRYLVVVETCMSLASQVVKLTKQLKEQTAERVTLQVHLQHLLEAQREESGSLPTSPSSPLISPGSSRPEQKTANLNHSALQKIKTSRTSEALQNVTNLGAPNKNLLKQKDEDSDKILRQLLGKEISENVCTQEKLSLEFQKGQQQQEGVSAVPKVLKRIPAEKRELKLARLRQIMQRSLSESDTDSYNSEDQKSTPVKKADKPRPQPIVENMECTESLQLMIKKHTSAAGRRFPFSVRSSKSADGHSSSPTSESSDPDYESHYQAGSVSRTQPAGDSSQSGSDGAGSQKVTTSPKSALKSPSSKRRTSQNLKLRVTFEEPVVQLEQAEFDACNSGDKESDRAFPPAPPSAESGDSWKRPFGTFRSIMETLSGNQNNNNNLHAATAMKTSATLPLSPLGRKTAEMRANAVFPTKIKNKTVSVV